MSLSPPLSLPLFDDLPSVPDVPALGAPAGRGRAQAWKQAVQGQQGQPELQGLQAVPDDQRGEPDLHAPDGGQALPFFMASPEALSAATMPARLAQASPPGLHVAAHPAFHPSVWRASQLGSACTAVTPSGFDALDAALPGGGWPHRVITELLLPHPGLGEMRLLAHALAVLARRPAGDGPARHGVMLFEPPAALCGWALAQIGIDARHWLVVQGRDVRLRLGELAAPAPGSGSGRAAGTARRPPAWDARLRQLGPGADVLWALEQALKSGHLGAALAWLPAGLKADALRRLQLAAQAHDGPVFVLREASARARPSVAPLRLLLAPAGIDALSVRVLKRRGPPLADALHLRLPAVLSERLRERAEAQAATEAALRPLLARRA